MCPSVSAPSIIPLARRSIHVTPLLTVRYYTTSTRFPQRRFSWGAPRNLCTRARIASIGAIPHILLHMCQQIRFALTRDHERLRTAHCLAATYGGIGAAGLRRRLASRAATSAPFGVGRPQDTKAAFAAHGISRNGDRSGFFVFVRVGRQARFRVRRACRARQGAADASRRTRRSLKTARDADAADCRRRFDIPSRISWSREAPISHCLCINSPLHPGQGPGLICRLACASRRGERARA